MNTVKNNLIYIYKYCNIYIFIKYAYINIIYNLYTSILYDITIR